MEHSRVLIPQVLMYDNLRDIAFWVTPAQSWKLLNVYPFLERIDPVDANYEAVRSLAGPAPEIYMEPEENYGPQKQD